MKTAIPTSLLLLALLFLTASPALAQDWPQWLRPDRDAHLKAFTAPDPWPTELKQLWKINVGPGDSTPALVGDRLVVCSRQDENELILCLAADDGHELWRDKYPAPPVTGPGARHPGPRSSPAVADGKIVAIGATGIVSCLSTDGKLLWRKDPFPNVVPQFFTSSSPLILGKLAIVHLGGKGAGALLALDLATGDEKWRSPDLPPMYSSPVAMTVAKTTILVTFSENAFVGVNAENGKLLWSTPFVPEGYGYNISTPVIDGDTIYYSGSRRGTFAVKVQKASTGTFTLKELWKNTDFACQYNTPVLHKGFLFGVSDRSIPFCINAADGTTAWKADAPQGRKGFATLVDAGPVLFVLPDTSTLIILKPDTTAYTELTRYKVADAPTYTFPIVSGSRIFIRDTNTLTLYSLK